MHSSHTNRRTRFAQPDPLLPSNAAARPSSQSRNRPAPDQPGKARIHRVRFVDYRPSAICSLALTPSTWDASTAFSHSTKGREVLAVGKGNGDIEIHVFVGIDGEEASKRPTTSRSQKQAWVIEKTLPAHLPSGPAEHLAFAHQTAVSQDDEDLMSSASELTQVRAKLRITPPRLFASTGSSTLYEWNWMGAAGGRPKAALPTEGGNIWSLAVNPSGTALAIGCEDGMIRLVNLWDGELEVAKRLDKVNTRCLSLAFGPQAPLPSDIKGKGKARAEETESRSQDIYLVAGGADSCLRKWDLRSGRCVAKMSTDRMGREQTLVWTVGVLSDHTIISGDSMGVVKFWNGVMGTQLQSIRSHKADVLCMSISPDQQSIYTSGVDQTTLQFTLINSDNSQEPIATGVTPSATARPSWVVTSTRRIHSHDVRAMTISPPFMPSSTTRIAHTTPTRPPVLLSGGIDMSISVMCAGSPSTSTYSRAAALLGNPLVEGPPLFDRTAVRKLPYVPQRHTVVQIAREGRLLVTRHQQSLTIWRLKAGAQPAAVTDSGTGLDDSESGWQKCAELSLKCSTSLIASAVSPDGRWLAVSDRYEAKLLRLEDAADGSVDPKRSKAFTQAIEANDALSESKGAVAFAFTPDSRRMVIATLGTSLLAVIALPTETKSKKCQVLKVFRQHAQLIKPGRALAGAVANGKTNGVNGHGKDMSDSSSSDEGEGEVEGEAMVSSISSLAVSDDGQWLATADLARRLHVFHLDSLSHQCALPSPEVPPSALAFIPQSPSHLIVGLPNNTLQIFDVEARRIAPWAQFLVTEPIKELHVLHEPLIGLALEPASSRRVGGSSTPASPMPTDGLLMRRPSSLSSGSPAPRAIPVLLAWGANWVCRMRLPGAIGSPSRRSSGTPQGVKRRAPGDDVPTANGVEEEEEDSSEEQPAAAAPALHRRSTKPITAVEVTAKYQPLLALDFLGPGEFVVVERPYFNLAEDLPQAFYRAGRYGT